MLYRWSRERKRKSGRERMSWMRGQVKQLPERREKKKSSWKKSLEFTPSSCLMKMNAIAMEKTWESMKESETNPDTSLRVFSRVSLCQHCSVWTLQLHCVDIECLISFLHSAGQIALDDLPWLTWRIHVRFCESWTHSYKRSSNHSQKCCSGKLYSHTRHLLNCLQLSHIQIPFHRWV